MFRQFLFIIFLSFNFLLYSQSHNSIVIDYGKFQATVYDLGYFEKESWNLGLYAFNYAPELIPFFAKLKKEYKIKSVVETGTFYGGTSVAFSLLFDKVHTIEIQENLFVNAQKNLEAFPNVQCYLGSSEKVLKKILPTLVNERVLFYLDAHWQDHWPLREELEEISKTHKDNCIIVIDDFKVPDRPDVHYDYYGKHECSYEYIQSELNKVFCDYFCYYLIPKSLSSRAKFIAIPNKWHSKR